MNKVSIMGVAVLIVIVLVVALVWFSHVEQVEGKVISKWTETNTSCDSDGNCSIEHVFQLEDGRIYSCFWGSRDCDRILPGMRIQFQARGYSVSLFGWRIASPSIFGFEDITPQ